MPILKFQHVHSFSSEDPVNCNILRMTGFYNACNYVTCGCAYLPVCIRMYLRTCAGVCICECEGIASMVCVCVRVRGCCVCTYMSK